MISVSGSMVKTPVNTTKINSKVSVVGSTGVIANNIVSTAIIRTGGGDGVYKTSVETKAINRGQVLDEYFIMTSFESAGDPISLIVHFTDDDAQLTSKCSISGRKVSFLSPDDIFGLNCTITYLYSVI